MTQSQAQTPQQLPEDAIILTFSATEVGIIAMLIIRGVARRQAIRNMPRYTTGKHREFSAFYDQLREAMEHEG